MGIIDFFFKSEPQSGQFVSEKAFKRNHAKLVSVTPHALEKLRKMNISSEKEVKLEYTFYANTLEKAGQLAFEIEKLGYTVEHSEDPDNKRLFIVTGWTTYMKTSQDAILDWTDEMCSLGHKFDCEFDGWMVDAEEE